MALVMAVLALLGSCSSVRPFKAGPAVHRPARPGARAAGGGGGQALLPCRDGAYRLRTSRWAGPYRWWFRASSTPHGLSQDAVAHALELAVSNVVAGHNDCGLPIRIAATDVYMGR